MARTKRAETAPGWSESPQWVERIAPVGGANRTSGWSESHHYPRGGGAIRPTRHALEAAVRDSLGLASPAQKHHWAEHLAMPCPA